MSQVWTRSEYQQRFANTFVLGYSGNELGVFFIRDVSSLKSRGARFYGFKLMPSRGVWEPFNEDVLTNRLLLRPIPAGVHGNYIRIRAGKRDYKIGMSKSNTIIYDRHQPTAHEYTESFMIWNPSFWCEYLTSYHSQHRLIVDYITSMSGGLLQTEDSSPVVSYPLLSYVRNAWDPDEISGKVRLGLELEVEGLPCIPDYEGPFYVKIDHSLRNNGREFVSPGPVEYKSLMRQGSTLFNFIKGKGGKASSRTSMQLHIDIRAWSVGEWQCMLIILWLLEPLLHSFDRCRRRSMYCVPMTESLLLPYIKLGIFDAASPSRESILGLAPGLHKYMAVNLCPINTQGSIELRMWNLPKTSYILRRRIELVGQLVELALSIKDPRRLWAMVQNSPRGIIDVVSITQSKRTRTGRYWYKVLARKNTPWRELEFAQTIVGKVASAWVR